MAKWFALPVASSLHPCYLMSETDKTDGSATATGGDSPPEPALVGKFASLSDITSSATPATHALLDMSAFESLGELGKSSSPRPAVSFSASASRTLAHDRGVGLYKDVVSLIRSSVIRRYIIYFSPQGFNPPRCLAPVRKKGIKWCFSENCGVSSHKECKPIIYT